MASAISAGCTLHSRAGAGKAVEAVQVRVTRSPEVALLGPDTSTVEGRSGEARREIGCQNHFSTVCMSGK